MSNTNDNTIPNLNLNDTFYNWFTTTNLLIDLVNPLNVYDVYAGDGLSEVRSGIPGTVEFNVLTDPFRGIDTLNNGAEGYKVSLDYTAVPSITDQTNDNAVIENDEFVFQRSGDIYKVSATDILPTTISSDHTFEGTISVGNLVVNSCLLTLNCSSTNRDNCGIVIESSADGSTNNVSLLYDEQSNAWFSSENLGIKKGKSFVSDSTNSIAYFPFKTSFTQGVVNLSLEKDLNTTTTEKLIFVGEFGARNKLTITNYSNTSKIDDLLILESGEGTNAVTTLTAPGAVVITDILNSSPFTQTPTATSVPITDSDGFVTKFANRVKLTISGGVVAGKMVRMSGSNAVLATPDTSTDARVIGLVENVVGSIATVITSGPFSGISGLSGLTAGSLYYLDYNGGVSTSPPPSTNNDVTKPIFVATSSTSGVLYPDLSSSATVSEGGISDAFTAVQISGQGGSGLFQASGTTTLTVEAGTGIQLSKSSNKLVITNTSVLPHTDPYSVFVNQDGTNASEYVALGTHSLLGRSTTGLVQSISINPGSLVGRIQDDSNDNNPVGSLTQQQALNILGLSGNQYYNTVKLYNITGTLIDTISVNSNETLKFRAGSNVILAKSGTDTVVISSTGDTNGSSSTQASNLDLNIQFSNGSSQLLQNLNYLNLQESSSIKFTTLAATNTDGETLYSVRPILNPNYLKLDDNNSTTATVIHDPEDTLQISGDDTNINSTLSVKNNNNAFTISLRNILRDITAISSKSSGSGQYILKLNPYQSYNTVWIESRTTAGNSGILKIHNKSVNSTVTNPSNYTYNEDDNGNCIWLYADNSLSGVGLAEDPTYYPIRTKILHADKVKCAVLDVDEVALKLQLQTSQIKSYDDFTQPTNPLYGKILIAPSYSTLGLLLNIRGNALNNSYAFMPAHTNSAIGSSTQTKTLLVSERIQFAQETTLKDSRTSIGNNLTASFGYESGRDLYINAYNNSTSQLIFKNSTTATTTIGFDGSGGYIKYNATSGGTDRILNLRAAASIYGITSLALGSTTTGYSITTSTTFTSNDVNKILYISGVTNGVATLSQSYFVKAYSSGQDISGDPLYTLYYAT